MTRLALACCLALCWALCAQPTAAWAQVGQTRVAQGNAEGAGAADAKGRKKRRKKRRKKKPKDKKSAPVEKPANLLQVMMIPLTGEDSGPNFKPVSVFNDTLGGAVRTAYSRPTEVQEGTSDIIAVLGCGEESDECFDAVADIVGVDLLLFGSVEQGQENGAHILYLTLVHAGKRRYSTKRISVSSPQEDEASQELFEKASAFLTGEESAETVEVAPPAPVEPAPIPEGDLMAIKVLVIPLTGKRSKTVAFNGPEVFTNALMGVSRSSGSRAVTSEVGKSDIIAITGCDDESPQCFDAVADVIGVDQMIFGSVEVDRDSNAQIVYLTLVQPSTRSYNTKRIFVNAAEADAASKEFETKARPFVSGKLNLVVPKAIVVGEGPPPLGPRVWNLGRVDKSTWGIVGTGTAALATGIAFAIVARGKQGEVDDSPIESADDFERLADLERSGRRYAQWGSGLMLVGGLAILDGIGLIIKQGYLESRAEPTIEFSVVPGSEEQGGLSFTVRGRF